MSEARVPMPTADRTAPGSRWRRLVLDIAPTALLLLAAVAPLVILAAMTYQRRWMSDDGFINLRIVANLLDGHGPVFNIGERVEAFTSPLWIAVLALLGAVGIRLEVAAVWGGLLASLTGFTLASLAVLNIIRGDDDRLVALRRRLVLPLGVGVLAMLPPVWEYGTSGLEGGLSFLWLGGSFHALVTIALAFRTSGAEGAGDGATVSRRRWLLTGTLLGLGPLIRPELALFSLGFLPVLAAGFWRYGRGERPIRAFLLLVLASGALPIAYQIFRMGYFAALAPNTALAKEAFESRWEQGWNYFGNFYGLYELIVPLPLLGLFWLHLVARSAARRAWMLTAVVGVTTLGGVVGTLYVVKVGGGFMHGRLLLPALFGMLIPVLLIPLTPSGSSRDATIDRVVAALVILVWMPICGLEYRVDPENEFGIGDERGWYARQSGTANPVRLEDYADFFFYAEGLELVQEADGHCPSGGETCERVLFLRRPYDGPIRPPRRTYPLDGVAAPGTRLVAPGGGIGIIGYLVGSDIHLADRHGLADPIASRLILSGRGRPGHEKSLGDEWLVARFTPPTPGEDSRITAARNALSCAPLAELDEAVRAPMSLSRFFRNVAAAPRLHALRIPADPWEAEAALCERPRAFQAMAGGEGGQQQRWQCPAGHTLSGLEGSSGGADRAVMRLAPACRPLTSDGDGHGLSGDVARGVELGGRGPEPFALACPADRLIVGMYGRADHWLRRLGLLCARVQAGSSGQPTRSNSYGYDVGQAFELTCPPGQIVNGVLARSGALVDAVGIVCGDVETIAERP